MVEVEFRTHGIARGGMGVTQLELRAGAIGRSRALGQNARRSARTDSLDQIRPWVGEKFVIHESAWAACDRMPGCAR